FIPPKKGRSHVLRIIRELLEFEPKGKRTDLVEALKYVSSVMKKKAIIFVLSDFMADGYQQTLKILSGKHDVTGIRIYDEREEEIPNLGLVQMLDAETGEMMMVNTGAKSVRIAYGKYFREREDYFKDSFNKSGAGTISTRVDEGYVKKLLGYFKRRA
ncbi:MAG TPA: VWA domain-containing protein, partial [Gillisia sp.]|nr:VWA domain-containing protein [Gillisia sp.]